MLEFKKAAPDDVSKTIKLCDLVFRSPDAEHNSMGKQFQLMLSEQNAENLMIAKDEEKVVSHLGTSLVPMIIKGHTIPYAQIGAVCTHPDYRKQGAGSKLLAMAIENFKANDIYFVAISGGRGLYRRNGSVSVGCTANFYVSADYVVKSSKEFKRYNTNEIVYEIIDVYNTEEYRYQRNAEQFEKLMDGYPCNGTRPQAITYVAYEADKPCAYISGCLDRGYFKIAEYAGESEDILMLAKNAADESETKKSIVKVPTKDYRYNDFFANAEFAGMNYEQGTFMILDAEKFYAQIKPMLVENGYDKEFDELPLDIFGGKTDEINLAHFLFDSFDRIYSTMREEKEALPLVLPNTTGFNFI